MRSFLTIFALLVWVPTLASASAVKGVRGIKRSVVPDATRNLKEKKCKKYAEPKAAAHDLTDPKAKASDPKAKGANDKVDPKAADPKMKVSDKAAPGPKDTPKEEGGEAKLGPKEAEMAREAECLEWEEASARDDEGSSAMVDPTMTSTGGTTTSTSEFDQINVDCDAIANDKGPTDTHSVSFSVNIDVLKSADARLSKIYDAMEQELQQKVAPRIAGCSSNRFLASGSSTTKIVHVDFGEMDFDHQGKATCVVDLFDLRFAKASTHIHSVHL